MFASAHCVHDPAEASRSSLSRPANRRLLSPGPTSAALLLLLRVQDHLGRAEGYNIVHADRQFIVPTDGKPIRGLIQDHVVAGVEITCRYTYRGAALPAAAQLGQSQCTRWHSCQPQACGQSCLGCTCAGKSLATVFASCISGLLIEVVCAETRVAPRVPG